MLLDVEEEWGKCDERYIVGYSVYIHRTWISICYRSGSCWGYDGVMCVTRTYLLYTSKRRDIVLDIVLQESNG
jgi:hypothetical protein